MYVEGVEFGLDSVATALFLDNGSRFCLVENAHLDGTIIVAEDDLKKNSSEHTSLGYTFRKSDIVEFELRIPGPRDEAVFGFRWDLSDK
jgi:hypothetical protein